MIATIDTNKVTPIITVIAKTMTLEMPLCNGGPVPYVKVLKSKIKSIYFYNPIQKSKFINRIRIRKEIKVR